MKVLDPKELEQRRQKRVKKHKTKRRRRLLLPCTIAVLLVYILGSVLVPLPSLQVAIDDVRLPNATTVSMPWPAYGQAAIGAVGYGLLETHGAQKQLPTASIAKVITAVAVLKVKPIEPHASPAMIQITDVDAAMYDRFWREGQSVVPVKAGTQLTQYQALQALLLPSANNMAEILVRWAF
jgi:serine-type D-Ala-D-Ala carboxypeptidase (penicillin-binding protein 5/6)